MSTISSFRKGQRVRLRAGELDRRPNLRVPSALVGTVLFSGNPYGKGHRTLVRISGTGPLDGRDGRDVWVPTDSLEPDAVRGPEEDASSVAEPPPPSGWTWERPRTATGEEDRWRSRLVSRAGDVIEVSPAGGRWQVAIVASDAPNVLVPHEPFYERTGALARRRAVSLADYVRLQRADAP